MWAGSKQNENTTKLKGILFSSNTQQARGEWQLKQVSLPEEALDAGSETMLFTVKFFEMQEEEYSEKKSLERTRQSRPGGNEVSKSVCAREETEQNVEKDQTPTLHSSNTNSVNEIQPDLRLELPI